VRHHKNTPNLRSADGQIAFLLVARKRVEHPFGWIKAAAGLFQLKHRGLPKVDWVFIFASAASNLTRLRRLTAAPA
jgi:hypothetical protein